MNLSERDKTILIALAVILVIVCYVEIFLLPMIGKISDTNQDIRDTNSKLQSMNVTTEKYKSNQQLKTDFDSKVAEASESLPSIPKEPEISYDLKTQADNAKVNISSISFGASSDFDPITITRPGETVNVKKLNIPDGKLSTMPADIICSGQYDAVLNFINNIETDKRIAEVQTVSISNINANSLQVSLNINYYYLNAKDNSNVGYKFVKDSSAYGKSNMFSK